MDYPARFSVDTPERIANWRVLVHWLLIIPHAIIVEILRIVLNPVWFVTWLVAIFTGKIPDVLARFFVMFHRYENRLLAYVLVLTDVYPKAEWSYNDEDPGSYPATTDIEAQLTDRNRLTVLLRPILAIPAFIWYAFMFFVVAPFALLIMFFVLLFTGRWPAGFHRFMVAVINLQLRFFAYMNLLTDRYPPFTLNPDGPAAIAAPAGMSAQ